MQFKPFLFLILTPHNDNNYNTYTYNLAPFLYIVVMK